MRMMIVDDSNVIRSRISRLVNNNTMSFISVVGQARNGTEALRIAQAAEPEIVTMDLTMPEMDGLACITELIKRYPEINILVVSAMDDKATAIQALKAGAKGFLPKPFTDEELKLALLEIIDSPPPGP